MMPREGVDPGKRSALTETPFVSVVLPVRNEARFIADTLGQLQGQRYPHDMIELLVCDGRSDDGTREIVSRMADRDARIELVDNPGLRSSAGRNVGFRRAKGEIVVVIDGHVELPDQHLIENLVECFRASGADCLGRPQTLIPAKGEPWSEAIALARASPLGHDPHSLIFSEYEGFAPAASMGAAYRPHVFDKIGFVDESFDACEDLEFNTRLDKAGLRCFTSPELTVRYYARTSPAQLFRQLFRYGFGRFKYLLRHPDHLTLGQLVSPVLVMGVLSLPLAWLLARPLAVAVSALIGLYLLVVLAEAVRLSLRTSLRHLGRYLVVFQAIHFGVGVGFLAALLRRGKA